MTLPIDPGSAWWAAAGLFLLLAAIAFACGSVGSLIGIGGGVFLIPILVLGFGFEIQLAIAASLLSVVANSCGSAATYVEQGLTNLRLGIFLESSTVVGGLLGALLSVTLLATRQNLLALAFVPVVAIAAALMLRAPRLAPDPNAPKSPFAERLRLSGTLVDPTTGASIAYRATRPAPGLLLTGLAGFGSGLLGVGGGIFNVPAMNAVMNVPLRVATATSTFKIGVTASAGALVYFLAGDMLLWLAASVALGSFAGSLLASHHQYRARTLALRWLFLGVLAVAALLMAARGVGVY